MAFRNTWSAFRAQLRRFAHARRGNVAMIFALSLIPITIAAGAGLDLSRALMARARLAEALDAAGLAIGATQNLTTDQITSLAQAYFKANYTADPSFGVPAAVTVTPGTQNVVLSTNVDMPTTLMHIVGINTISVGYSAKVVWGQTKLWVSLVLDNTGSMCEPDSQPCDKDTNTNVKINALKTATKQLLTTLQGASANPGDVQVAIVPFVKDVNVGTSNVGASWIDWTSWNASHGTCDISGKNSQSSCQSAHGSWTGGSCSISGINNQSTCITTHGVWKKSWYGGGSCSIWGYNSKSSCEGAVGVWTPASCSLSGYSTQTSCQSATGTWTPSDHSLWNGCVIDRGNGNGPDTVNNYDVMNTAPTSGVSASQFPAEQYSSCPQAITGLSDDWDALGKEVDAMVASGNTNQTIGLVWGWHALSQGDPLNAPALPADTSRYIIIMSDGLNTQDRWYSQQSSIDDRMSKVCTNAKAAGITIYAIYVDLNGTQGNSTVLQNCATDSSKYFDLTTSGAIITTFNNIAQQITQLRVAQ